MPLQNRFTLSVLGDVCLQKAVAYLSAKNGSGGRSLYDAWLLDNRKFRKWLKEKNSYLGLQGGTPISYDAFISKLK